jgi:hypothetical protein
MALLLLLFTVLPRQLEIVDRFDVFETNHYHATCDTEGELSHKYVFTQLLCLNWNHETLNHQCEAWKMVTSKMDEWKLSRDPILVPRYDHARRVWVVIYNDGDVIRRIEAKSYRISNTDFDPEVEERTTWPKEKRTDLTPYTGK